MKKIIIQRWLWFVMVLWIDSGIIALPAQKLVYSGEWLYDALSMLALEQELIFFTGSALTIAQVEDMVAEIDENYLSAGSRVLYERIHKYLRTPSFVSFTTGPLSFNIDAAALQPEFYFKTNPELDWIYDREQRNPFFLTPMSISLSSYITLSSDLYIGENRRLSEAHNNYFNFPFDTMIDGVQSIDTNFPKRAYLSAGLPLGERVGINFRIGIGDDAYGRTKTGSIILSDTMKGVNYASFTIYSPFIKYSTDIRQLEVNKYLYLHYFQIRLFNRLSFAFVEGVMVNAPFEIRYLNPMMIFHGFSGWEDYGDYNEQIGAEEFSKSNSRVGSFGGLIIDWRLRSYLRIYGLAAMNEFQIPGMEDRDGVPDDLAFQLGSETYIPVSDGYWTFGFEGIYTYPYMYILAHKNWSFYRESYEVSNDAIREWIGTPFGPDSIGGTLWAEYHDSSLWSASLSFLFAAQGENSGTEIFDKPKGGYYPQTPEEANFAAPTGTPAYTYQISASGKWMVYDWLSFTLRTEYKVIQNFKHKADRLEQGFEITLSIQLSPKPKERVINLDRRL